MRDGGAGARIHTSPRSQGGSEHFVEILNKENGYMFMHMNNRCRVALVCIVVGLDLLLAQVGMHRGSDVLFVCEKGEDRADGFGGRVAIGYEDGC